jgi:hypothetical protein
LTKLNITGNATAPFLSGILVLSALAALSADVAVAPDNIYGTYRSRSSGTTRDVVQITRRADRKIGIDLTLHFAVGQTCHMRTDGEWARDRLVVSAEGMDEHRPCRLEAFFSEGRVSLKDEGQRCAQVYCGSRGKIDGAVLPKVRPPK